MVPDRCGRLKTFGPGLHDVCIDSAGRSVAWSPALFRDCQSCGHPLKNEILVNVVHLLPQLRYRCILRSIMLSELAIFQMKNFTPEHTSYPNPDVAAAQHFIGLFCLVL